MQGENLAMGFELWAMGFGQGALSFEQWALISKLKNQV
jgi:hypothetical protein